MQSFSDELMLTVVVVVCGSWWSTKTATRARSSTATSRSAPTHTRQPSSLHAAQPHDAASQSGGMMIHSRPSLATTRLYDTLSVCLSMWLAVAPSLAQVYSHIRACVDLCHRDGVIKVVGPRPPLTFSWPCHGG